MLLLLFSLYTFAEYRAFELVIRNQVTGAERVVLSNLDPDQYRGYHPLDPGETITYRATWMCKGNTSDQPVCPKVEKAPRPNNKPEQGPDSNLKKK